MTTTSNLTKLLEHSQQMRTIHEEVIYEAMIVYAPQFKDSSAVWAKEDLAKDEIIAVMAEALEWVIRPKHDEFDDYTRLACAQHRAFEAQQKVEELAAKALYGAG